MVVEILVPACLALIYRYTVEPGNGGYGPFALYSVFTCCLIVITFIDMRHRIIPDAISLPMIPLFVLAGMSIPGMYETEPPLLEGSIAFLLCAAGLIVYVIFKVLMIAHRKKKQKLIYSLLFLLPILVALLMFLDTRQEIFSEAMRSRFLSSMSGVLVGGVFIWVQAVFGNLLFRQETMGRGDIKLMLGVGAVLGWKSALMTALFAPVPGAIVGGYIYLVYKSKKIAYGPFIALSAFAMIFLGKALFDLITYPFLLKFV